MIEKTFEYSGKELIEPLTKLLENLNKNANEYKNKNSDVVNNKDLVLRNFNHSISKCKNFLREAKRTPKTVWKFDQDDLLWLYQYNE